MFHGWEGFIDGTVRRVTSLNLLPYIPIGGTMLKASRRNVFNDDADRLIKAINDYNLDCVVAIGGDGSLRASNEAIKLGI